MTDRATRIASIRALADILDACPDLPVPVDAFISVYTGDELAAVEQLLRAQAQLNAAEVPSRREPEISRGKHLIVAFDLPGFHYEAFRRLGVDTAKAVA